MPILRTEESGLLLIHARDVSIDPEAFRYVVLEMLEEANVVDAVGRADWF